MNAINIAVSQGDPNGIGLECFVKAILSNRIDPNIDFTLFGNIQTASEYLELINQSFITTNDTLIIGNHQIRVVKSYDYSKVEFGKLTKEAGLLSARAIETSLESVVNGNQRALLTLPVNKYALYLAGWKFPGHTEMLANAFNLEPMMVLLHEDIRVSLATIHLPLNQVASRISKELICNKATILNSWLKLDMGIVAPKIACLGLNPHAGEQGSIGKEEVEIIMPAIEFLKESISIDGPFAADGFFAHGVYKDYDCILAMYHDQGLIPLKLLARGAGVNVTAGLPIIRTSPDHGTAFEIAGKNIAESDSTESAINCAINIIKNRIK